WRSGRSKAPTASRPTRCGPGLPRRTRPPAHRPPRADNLTEEIAMQVDEIVAGANATNVAANWEDAHRYTPSCKHRRRLILDWLKPLQFSDCLDAGCAQAFLLQAIVQQFGVAGFGGDVSDEVIARNRLAQPDCSFEVLDLTRDVWPGGRQFDLV